MPGELPGMSYASNLGNVKMGQTSLRAGPNAASCPKELFARITREQRL